MNKVIVVTEGKHDRHLLEALLRLENGTQVFAAGGRSAAISLARSFLLNGRNDVALVVDADTLDPSNVESGTRFLQQSLGEVATRTQWRVFVIAPEIEILFFDNRDVLEAFVGTSVTDTEFIEGRFAPKKTLDRLLGGRGLLRAYEKILPQINLGPLRQQPAILKLQQFLDGVAQKAAA